MAISVNDPVHASRDGMRAVFSGFDFDESVARTEWPESDLDRCEIAAVALGAGSAVDSPGLQLPEPDSERASRL